MARGLLISLAAKKIAYNFRRSSSGIPVELHRSSGRIPLDVLQTSARHPRDVTGMNVLET